MDFLKDWIAPVAIGGVIGLFTNWLAIKMLFRPLREARLFGFRLPFTPGILPREKERLARSVGETVAKELLTPGVLKERLEDPVLREKLESAIGAFLEEAAARDSGQLLGAATAVPSEEDFLAPVLSGAMKSLASSDAFRHALGAALGEASRRAFDVRLSDVLPPEAARTLADRLAKKADSEGTRSLAMGFIDSVYDSGARAQASLVAPPALVPSGAIEPLIALASESIYKAAVPLLENLLADPDLRKDMEARAMEIVRRALGRLGTVQRLIVAAANYEQSIAGSMPETIRDITAAISGLLRDPTMPGRISASVTASLGGSPGGGAGASLSALISREALKEALSATLDRLSGASADIAHAAEYRAVLMADRRLRDIAPWAEVLVSDAAARAAPRLTAMVAGESGPGNPFAGLGGYFVADLAAGLRGLDLGTALGIGPEARKTLASQLAGKAAELVAAQTERIVAAIDIKAMVVARIEQLDMLEMERIILSVVERELYWITVLGGILGAVIGFIQAVLFAL